MSALHIPTGRNKYCGPTSLSAISGLSKDVCARALRERSGRRAIRGAYISELTSALRLLGFSHYEQTFSKQRSLEDWLAGRTAEERQMRAIVYVTGHYIAVQGDQIADSMTTSRAVLLSPGELRQKVLGLRVRIVFWIHGPERAELPGQFKREDDAKYAAWLEGQRARIKATKLATLLGLRVVRDRYGLEIQMEHEATLRQHLEAGGEGILAEGESAEDALADMYSLTHLDWREVLTQLQCIKELAR